MSVEKPPIEALHEIRALYGDLAPIDRNREVYLVALLFRQELGLARAWDNDLETVRMDYARCAGDSVNATIDGSGAQTSEEIEDVIVQQVNTETNLRWLAYTSHIRDVGREDVFAQMAPEASAITFDMSEKADQVRATWRKFLEDYGVPGGVFMPGVRAEFMTKKVIWDTSQEDLFLRRVLTAPMQEAAA